MARRRNDDRFFEIKRTMRTLPCTLTQDEWIERARQLSRTGQDVVAEEQRQGSVKQALKDTLERLKSERSRLDLVVARNEEEREIEVVYMGDAERMRVSVTRADTGEVIEERPMSDQERQMTLPVEAVPA